MSTPAIVGGALILLVAHTARAADTWTYAASEHFEVYTTGGERTGREALAYFERVHAFFTEFLMLSPRTAAPTRLIVFSNDRQFAPYRPSPGAVAFYQSGPDRDYIVMESFDEDASPIVVHEYAHAVIRHAGVRFPLWLNEGIAEFFSTMEPDGDRMNVGIVPVGRLEYIVNGAPMMTLDQLFAIGPASPEYRSRTHAGVFYSQSWALVHMLLADDRYRARTDAFLQLVGKGVPSTDAMAQVYGRDVATIAADLNNYVRQSQYTFFRVRHQPPPTRQARSSRAVDAFEAGLVTANLLASTLNREDDARAAFEQLAAERPDDLALLEARASFELRQRRRTQARPFLARAVDMGSTNPAVYRDLAALDPDRAEALLRRAVELAPDDPETRVRYASLLLQADKTGDAMSTLAAMHDVPPELRFQFYQLLSNAYLRLGSVEEGRSAAVRAAASAAPGAEAEFAARLLESIDAFAAARNRSLGASGPAPPPAPDARRPDAAASAHRLAAGRIRNIACASGSPVIELATSDGTMRFLVDMNTGVRVVGTEPGAAPDLRCGPKDVPVRVEYAPHADGTRDTVGVVRTLDYSSR